MELCSVCGKNPAVIFLNKKDENGKSISKGYCLECAQKQGINPLKNLSEKDMNNMTKQIENIVSNLAENMDLNSLSEQMEDMDPEDIEKMEQGTPIFGAAIPLGSIFSNMFGESQDESAGSSSEKKKVKVEKKKDKRKKTLETYGTNLTQKAKNGQLDMVIGRDKEIQRMTQILNRRSKNNPCLIGEPGVGKTAIAQGLAIKIANGNVPAKLLNKEVYLLDMTAVVAGTQFRGQFEARMKSIIEECKSLGNIILVIDEIHNIIGAGDAEHSMNAANILKPSLSTGEVQLIGTTTLKEYRKYIEKDSALERRFQPVIVEEPSITDSINILEGIKKYYEDYHKVKISNDVIKQAVIMSEKYIHDRFLPDKAIDILDEACSRINLNNKDLYQLEILKGQLKAVQEEKEEAALADSTEDYKKAAELKAKECSLIEQIDNLNDKMKLKNLTIQDIAEVIESWTKIPVKKMEKNKLRLLVVEDEKKLCDMIAKSLHQAGYEVDTCNDGEEALDMIYAEMYDLIVLDLNLPGMDGMDILRELRKENEETKVLILSARSQIADKVDGLDAGANDYMEKPFHLQELEARVRSLTRRKFVQKNVCLECGSLRFDTRERTAYAKDKPVALTRKENGILEYLLLNQGRPVSQEELIEHVWDSSVDSFSGSIRVHMSSLRKKLKAGLGYDPIVNKIGEGYKIGGGKA